MDYRVAWTPGADADLEGVAEFIRRNSPYYASVVVAEFRSAAGSLKRYPFRYRVVPEAGIDTVREVLVYDYRMLYEIRGNLVVILMIVHAARDLRNFGFPD